MIEEYICEMASKCHNRSCYHKEPHEGRPDCSYAFCFHKNVKATCVKSRTQIDKLFDDLCEEL